MAGWRAGLFGGIQGEGLGVVVRAGEPGPARMNNPDIHPSFLGRKLDPFHLPRGDHTQQMPVQLGVTHDPI